MIKRIVILAIACIMLTGSVIFPLGDFSLARDLPVMYRDYSKIAAPEELGVIDFIGDYLLHGKEIFGHNTSDKSPGGTNSVQFRHQPAPLLVLLTTANLLKPGIQLHIIRHSAILITTHTSGFKNKLFRPPLA